MADETTTEEVVTEPELEVTPVAEKPGTVVDLEPSNPEGEVIVYEEDGSWHKEVKGAE